jgi:hypothetical protein
MGGVGGGSGREEPDSERRQVLPSVARAQRRPGAGVNLFAVRNSASLLQPRMCTMLYWYLASGLSLHARSRLTFLCYCSHCRHSADRNCQCAARKAGLGDRAVVS